MGRSRADIIDFNCGCPLGDMLGRKGGAYLLKHQDKLEKMMNAILDNTKKPVTVKIRSGWDDNSVNGIEMWHTLEHLDDWWSVLLECVRILKVGGTLDIRVPDESSSSALTYRDHNHVFSQLSFHGIQDRSGWGTNAWAAIENDRVPLIIERYNQVPFPKYNWMTRWGFRWILVFCSNHLRNFIWEQQFHFRKIGNE